MPRPPTPIVKVCGLTRPEDAALAVRLGARLVGCTTDSANPRAVTPSEAKEIFQAAGRSAIRVLCFRGGDAAFIQESAKKASARHVQLDQVPESIATALEEQGLTVYRVYRVPVGSNMLPGMIPTPCDKRPALLRVSDGKEDLTFPWDILGNEAPTGTFVSGNVRPENVCALLTHRVYGIDICRGVERAPGIKDEDRMAMFFDSLNAGY